MGRKIGDYTRETEGLNFKEKVLAKEKCLEQGYYWDDMPIKQEQLIEYQVFYAKLLQVAVNAREITRNVAGSPMVREGGECIIGIYTPEGHAIVLSVGVLLHVYSMTELIRFMAMNDYEDNPGIRERDFFFNNDPHCGGQHSQDQFTVTPIFHDGRLVAWTGGMSHEMETGATGPGGYDPQAVNRYYEGLLISPMKIASNDILHTDYRITVEHSTRDATYWLMDLQAKMTGCMYVRESLKKLVAEYGVDFFLEACQEIVEDGRRATLNKIRTRFSPGVYRARTFEDMIVPGRETRLVQINTETTVDREGYLNIDLEGCSREGPWPANGTIACTRATFYCTLSQILMYDCKFNAGSYYALRSHIPDHSIFACGLQAATSKYIGNTGSLLTACLFDAVSRMYYVAGDLEEVVAPCSGTHAIPLFGYDYSGRPFGAIHLDNVSKGSGGRALRDGVHTHYIYFNPEGDTGDAEIAERTMAIKYLGRRHRPDSGGFGKYRAGATLETVTMIHNGSNCVTNIGGADYYVATTQGLMGGYPPGPTVVALAKNTNLKEVFEQGKPYPVALGSPDCMEIEKYVAGDVRLHLPAAYPNTEVENYDVLYLGYVGAAGFGDPLERDPELIVKDLVDGTTTGRAAREVYGAVIERVGPLSQDLKVNREETQKLRAHMREERRQRGLPASQYISQQRQRVAKGDLPKASADMINELLQFSPRWGEWFKREWGLPDSFDRVPAQS